MAISRARARRHIEENCGRLKQFAQNRNWPRFIFHTTQVECAVAILRAGCLLPRGEQEQVIHDVANQGALWNNPGAHNFVRMYFRPKTSFHLSTEGIKCLGDPYRRDRQMSIPITLVLLAEQLLATDGVGFVYGNFARGGADPGYDEKFFDQIPFNKVYHDQPLRRDELEEVQNLRMSEVVFKGPLPLKDILHSIICRTPFDRQTLLYLLGDASDQYAPSVRTEQLTGSIYLHKELYLREISFAGEELVLRFHTPVREPKDKKYHVKVTQYDAAKVTKEKSFEVSTQFNAVRVMGFKNDVGAVLKIELEDTLAFHGRLGAEGWPLKPLAR
jgi:hypothetical protein